MEARIWARAADLIPYRVCKMAAKRRPAGDFAQAGCAGRLPEEAPRRYLVAGPSQVGPRI
jgi:hypothetical protein